jgi:hypothetical protein
MHKLILPADYIFNPPLSSRPSVYPVFNGGFLAEFGFVMLVTVRTPSYLSAPPRSAPVKSKTVVALFDTGATKSSIDLGLAAALEFETVGVSSHFTAAGPMSALNFVADVSFPNVDLRGFSNLEIGSCKLPFDINLVDIDPMAIRNVGMLIGRDIMSKWNIVWNGPTSTVFISD